MTGFSSVEIGDGARRLVVAWIMGGVEIREKHSQNLI